MKAKKIISVVLTAALIATAMPAGAADTAAAKKKLNKPSMAKTLTIKQGKSKTLTVKKGSYKIKSVKWSSTRQTVAAVKKKGKNKATVSGVLAGKATIKAKVTVKKTKNNKKKTFTLKTKVTVKKATSAADDSDTSSDVPKPAPTGADKLTKTGYDLKWEEEFEGDKLNRDDWNVELHERGWVNQEKQEYIDSEENIQVKDGVLHIKPKKTGEKQYTSGRVNTQNKHDFKYGIFEAKVKMPKGAGYLPAFWMMPTDENLYGQWPKCGEIDIAEVMGQDTSKLYGTIHYGEPHKETQGNYVTEKGAKDFYDDYHTFAVEWVPGRITWYVDGIKYHEARDWYTAQNGGEKLTFPAPFDQKFYMILNLAVAGSWVGDTDDATDADMDNQELAIDYVRAYQKPASEYNEDVSSATATEGTKLREPDEKGNYIVNGDFSKDEDLVKDEGWAWKLAQNGDGSATIADNKVTMKTTAAGDVDYSLQLVQNDLPMEKGASYQLSFDAKASEARNMKVAIQGPDQGWIAYLAQQNVELTTEMKTYTYDFTVDQSTDPNGRLDFNIGAQGSTADIELTNVVLKKTGSDAKTEKTVGADGNYIYNGDFNKGTSRLGHWEILERDKKYISVTNKNNEHRLKIVAPAGTTKAHPVILEQSEMGMLQQGTYLLSYKAYKEKAGDNDTSLRFAYGNIDFTPQALSDKEKTYTQKFDMDEDITREEANFSILITAPGTYYIDDVFMADNALLKNGSFNGGMANWNLFVNAPASATSVIDSLTEDTALDVTINDTGSDTDDWFVQLNQENINLEYGKKYRLTFKAKSTIERKIQFRLLHNGETDNNWDVYSNGNEEPMLTNEYQTFTKEFKMEYQTDEKARFNITMGTVAGTRITTPHHVFIDDIELVEIS